MNKLEKVENSKSFWQQKTDFNKFLSDLKKKSTTKRKKGMKMYKIQQLNLFIYLCVFIKLSPFVL